MTNNTPDTRFFATDAPRNNWIDANNYLAEIELRRAHLTLFLVANTSLAIELAGEHRMRARRMIDSIHSAALDLNVLRSI